MPPALRSAYNTQSSTGTPIKYPATFHHREIALVEALPWRIISAFMEQRKRHMTWKSITWIYTNHDRGCSTAIFPPFLCWVMRHRMIHTQNMKADHCTFWWNTSRAQNRSNGERALHEQWHLKPPRLQFSVAAWNRMFGKSPEMDWTWEIKLGLEFELWARSERIIYWCW